MLVCTTVDFFIILIYMKKIYFFVALIIFSFSINLVLVSAKATSQKPVTKKSVVKKTPTKNKVIPKAKTNTKKGSGYGTSMTWDKSALKIISNLNGFDGSTYIRNSYVKKVEAYARRNNIKIITAKVVDDMRE